MLLNRQVWRRLSLVAFAVAIVALGADRPETPTEDSESWIWIGPWAVTPSPDGSLIAFMLQSDPEETQPLLVIDGSGELLMDTAESVPGPHMDMPVGWFPDGKSLLVCRHLRPGPASANGLWDLLVMPLDGGRTESLSGDKGGLSTGRARVVDQNSCVVRVSGTAFGAPGLYLFQRSDGQWRSNLLLAESEERQRINCVWARRQNGAYRLVVRARDRAGTSVSYWSLAVDSKMDVALRLIAALDGWAGGQDVSPDGKVLAAIRREAHGLAGRLVLIPVDPAAEGMRDVECGDDVIAARFSPSGGQLLLWTPGWTRGAKDEDKEGPPAEIRIMSLADDRVVEVELPAELSCGVSLSSVSWFSEGSIGIGVINSGLGVLDLSTGTVKMLWRVERGR